MVFGTANWAVVSIFAWIAAERNKLRMLLPSSSMRK